MRYSAPGQAESPQRIYESIKLLKKEGFKFSSARVATKKELRLAHSPEYIKSIEDLSFPDDEESPKYPDILYYASLSSGAALKALEHASNGENSFSLMRPPGHHAGNKPMGFCYLNNAVIAALSARDLMERVAVLDIDYHHGNGSQEILLGKSGILHLDIHETNSWPGTGKTSLLNCLNFSVEKDSYKSDYIGVLKNALERIKTFNPNILVVSAGFDTYKNDPVGGLNLEMSEFQKIGEAISSTAKDLEITVCSILEGGYSEMLPECILSYLNGFEK